MNKNYFKTVLMIFTVFTTLTLLTGNSTGGQINGYPETFDGKGTIDAIVIKNNYISISDMSFYISPKARFNTPTLLNVSLRWFLKGQKVGYILDGSGQIESLWLLK